MAQTGHPVIGHVILWLEVISVFTCDTPHQTLISCSDLEVGTYLWLGAGYVPQVICGPGRGDVPTPGPPVPVCLWEDAAGAHVRFIPVQIWGLHLSPLCLQLITGFILTAQGKRDPQAQKGWCGGRGGVGEEGGGGPPVGNGPSSHPFPRSLLLS